MVKLSKSNARGVEQNRLHLRLGSYAAYARGMSGMHRAASIGQQAAIWNAIREDRMEHHFGRIHDGKALLAIEPAREDDELVMLELAA